MRPLETGSFGSSGKSFLDKLLSKLLPRSPHALSPKVIMWYNAPMNEQSLENIVVGGQGTKNNVLEEAPRNKYEQYRSLGGVINEEDYQSALDRIKGTVSLDKNLISQAGGIARASDIELHNLGGQLDPRVILYGILRTDTNPNAEYHHSQMSDQKLFAEALRMLGDEDSLQKLIVAHPNIFS